MSVDVPMDVLAGVTDIVQQCTRYYQQLTALSRLEDTSLVCKSFACRGWSHLTPRSQETADPLRRLGLGQDVHRATHRTHARGRSKTTAGDDLHRLQGASGIGDGRQAVDRGMDDGRAGEAALSGRAG